MRKRDVQPLSSRGEDALTESGTPFPVSCTIHVLLAMSINAAESEAEHGEDDKGEIMRCINRRFE